MSSLEKLYQSPLGTAGEFAVVVSGAVGAARPKLTHAPHNLTLMQVYAGRPVYAKCTAEAGCLTIEATDQSTDGTRVYFLPWSIGSIYRIRPKVEDTVELKSYRLERNTFWKEEKGMPVPVETCKYSVAKIERFWP